MKIVNTALERVKNSVNTFNKGTKSCKSLYFCPVCVVAVEMVEKKLHNKSMLHKNAVKLEKIFTEFSNLYAKDGEDDDSDNSENEIDKAIKKIVKKKINPKSNKTAKKNDRFPKNKISVQGDKNVNIPIVKSTENIQHNEKLTNIEILERDLTRNYEKLMMQFDTISTDTDRNDFFTDNLELDIKKQESDSEIHDKNIDNTSSTDILTGRSKITECLKDSSETDTELFTDKTKVVKNEDVNNININITKEDSHPSNEHHHLEVTQFYVYCKVCKKNIASNEFDHIKDLKHEINYEIFIEENSLYRTDSKHIECRICNLSFLCEDEISHCDEIRHITNCERLKKRNSC